MSSGYQKQIDLNIDQNLKLLIPTVCGFQPHQQNFQIAYQFASSNLRYHTFPDTDRKNVQKKFTDMLQKITIINNPDRAMHLKNAFIRFQEKILKEDYNDIHYRVLDFLLGIQMKIEQASLISLQQGQVQVQVEKGPKLDFERQMENQKILNDWGLFEASSSEGEEDISIQEEKVKEIPKKKFIVDDPPQKIYQYQEQPNFLNYISNPKRRTYNEFVRLNSSCILDDKMNHYLLYQPQMQNKSADLCFELMEDQQRFGSYLKVAEKDIVTSILYALQQQETQIIKLIEIENDQSINNENFEENIKQELRRMNLNQFQVSKDICVTHLSPLVLQNQLVWFISCINLIFCLKCLVREKLQYFNTKQLSKNKFEREDKVQEAFWYSLDNYNQEFKLLVVNLMKQVLYHSNKYEFWQIFKDSQETKQYFSAPLTFISLKSKLQSWVYTYQTLFTLCIQVAQLSEYQQVVCHLILNLTKESIFSSPTLCLVEDYLQITSIQQGDLKHRFLKLFLDSIQPYCVMLDGYFDFHNVSNLKNWDVGQFIPKFLTGVIDQLQAIGSGFQMYTKAQDENHIQINKEDQIQKINFQDRLMQCFEDHFQLTTDKTIKRGSIPYIKLDQVKLYPHQPVLVNQDDINDEGPFGIYSTQGKKQISKYGDVLFDISGLKKEIQPEEYAKFEFVNKQIIFSDIVPFLSEVQCQQFYHVLCMKFRELISLEHRILQKKLLRILFGNLEFLKVMKFYRTIYFFERIDIMQLVIDKIAEGSAGLGRLKALQSSLKESFNEFGIQPKYLIERFQLQIDFTTHQQVQQTISLMNPRNFQVSIQLPHPLNLIIDDNAQTLYNMIMQNLIFFKNSKHNLQSVHLQLKKTISRVQSQKKHHFKREDSDDENNDSYAMIDEQESEYKRSQMKNLNRILFKMCLFVYEMLNFINAYEYFLFVSVIQQSMKEFEKAIAYKEDFESIVQLHMTYLRFIADKMFLNQKTSQISETVNSLLSIAQNAQLLSSRISSLAIVDSFTIKVEAERSEQELNRMQEKYRSQMGILVILFDKDERKAFAPEMIEAIFKANFNKFYQDKYN